MRHDDDGRMLEQFLEDRGIVDQHISRRCPHECLDAARLIEPEGLDFLDIAVGRTEVEAEIGRAAAAGGGVLVGKRRARRRLRVDVRHIHETRDAARDGGCGFAREVAFLRQARLAEVHLVIDHAGHQELAPGVDHLAAGRRRDARTDLNDTVAGDQHVGVSHLALVDEACIADE